MTNNHHKAKQIQANQRLKILHVRLASLLKKQDINKLHQSSGISRAALYRYISNNDVPTLPKLALIAQECSVSLAWLFSEDERDEKQANTDNNAPPKLQQLTVTDDVMHPTIKQHVNIQYQLLKPIAKKKRCQDGLYVLTNQQGLIVRRVQWCENNDSYRVYGDNPNYPPQIMSSIAPIGKVTAIIQPI